MPPTSARALAFALLVCAASGSSSVSLTEETFDAQVFHPTRQAFVLFFAPWCGHCKALKPAWEEFAERYKDSPNALVAEVDCTAEDAKALCEKYEVEGFPDLKTAEPGSDELEDMEVDERSADELDAFAKKALMENEPCSVNALGGCSEEDRALLERYVGLSVEERAQEFVAAQEPIRQAKQELKKIEKKIEALEDKEEELEERVEEMKRTHGRKIKLMRQADLALK